MRIYAYSCLSVRLSVCPSSLRRRTPAVHILMSQNFRMQAPLFKTLHWLRRIPWAPMLSLIRQHFIVVRLQQHNFSWELCRSGWLTKNMNAPVGICRNRRSAKWTWLTFTYMQIYVIVTWLNQLLLKELSNIHFYQRRHWTPFQCADKRKERRMRTLTRTPAI